MTKKEFKAKHPGYLNVLKNIFGPLRLSKPVFGDEIKLTKDYLFSNHKYILNFKLDKNRGKFSKIIDRNFDFDLYTSNIYKKNDNNPISFNTKVDFSEYNASETEYIEYLNDFNIKEHLNSKFKDFSNDNFGMSHIADIISSGMGIMDTDPLRIFSGDKNIIGKVSLKQIEEHRKKSWLNSIFSNHNKVRFIEDINEINDKTTIYEVLGKPIGKVWFDFRSVARNISDLGYQYLISNPDIFFGYKHKANYVLKIEILASNNIFYQDIILLDTEDQNGIGIIDYDKIEKNIIEYLSSLEDSKLHEILSRNLGINSLVESLTGKNFKNQKSEKQVAKNKVRSHNRLNVRDFSKYLQIAVKLSQYKGSPFGPINMEGRKELFLFNAFYIWLYLTVNKIIEKDPHLAQRYIAELIVEYNQFYPKKIESDDDMIDFIELHKSRTEIHFKELKLFTESRTVPQFLFECLFEGFPLYDRDDCWFPETMIDTYGRHINNIQDAIQRIQ